MNRDKTFQEGDTVVLIDIKEREYLLELKQGAKFHTNYGVVLHDKIIGKREGVSIGSEMAVPFRVFKPTLAQIILNMPRHAQIIYPKDIGIILMLADIFPGAIVVEIGTGFGALTMALVRAVGERGKVISYEIKEDVGNKARKNLQKYIGDPENYEIVNKDALDGIDVSNADRVITDVPQPWLFLDEIQRVLATGGLLLNFLPTIIQSKEITEALLDRGCFAQIQTIEVLVRPWNIKGRSVRPVHRMTAHTGFITTSRKVSRNRLIKS